MKEKILALFALGYEPTPTDQLKLIEQVLDSLDFSNLAIDVLRAIEVVDRFGAYRRCEIYAVPLPEALAKFQPS